MANGVVSKHRLSFGHVHILSDSLAEVIVDNGIVVSLEMVDDFERFLNSVFPHQYSLLVNKINHYSLSFEAKLSVGSSRKLNALAIICYNQRSWSSVDDLIQTRRADKLTIKAFSAYELGRSRAIAWLNQIVKQKSP